MLAMLDSLSKTRSPGIEMNLDFKELTKDILSRKRAVSREHIPLFFEKDLFSSLAQAPISPLKRNFISQGMLCKDCNRYLARTHYSVCKTCYQKRVKRFAESGGFYVLTDRARQQLEDELRVW
jgi:hypothetical protein